MYLNLFIGRIFALDTLHSLSSKIPLNLRTLDNPFWVIFSLKEISSNYTGRPQALNFNWKRKSANSPFAKPLQSRKLGSSRTPLYNRNEPEKYFLASQKSLIYSIYCNVLNLLGKLMIFSVGSYY